MDTKTTKAEEAKKRNRSPNKTKADKLADINKKIAYHEKCIESNNAKIEMIKEVNRVHKEVIDDLNKNKANIESTPDKVNKSAMKAVIRAKWDAGETLTPEEEEFVKKNF